MVISVSKTPHYVLREGNHPTSVNVHATPAQPPSTAIFGFSDKLQYDAFISSSSFPLTPYPLVRRFLIDHLDNNGHTLKLVAIDAATPLQPHLFATTYQSLLAALQNNEDSVPITHQLSLDERTAEYTITAIAEAS